MNDVQRLLPVVALCAAVLCFCAPAHAIQIADGLLVDLSAAHATAGTGSWENAADAGNPFVETGDPSVAALGPNNNPGVSFNGTTDYYRSTVDAQAGLVGPNPTRTIEAWVYNPGPLVDEETILSWGSRSIGDGSNMSFNYGVHAVFGAAGQWGPIPDLGWNGAPASDQWHHLVYTHDGTTSRVYADGVLKNQENHAGLLDTFSPAKITLAGQNTNGGVDVDAGLRGSLALGQVRIHDGALSGDHVYANFVEEAAGYGFSVPSMVPPAELIHRYSFSENAGTQLTDSIGGADGVLMGAGGSLAGGRLDLPGGAANSGAAYGDLPNGLISGLTDVTIEAWMTVDAVQAWSRIFDFGSRDTTEAGGAPGEIITAAGTGGLGDTYLMLSANIGGGADQRLEMRGDGGNQNSDSIGTTVYGTEAHIVVTFEDATDQLKYYRDGQLVSTAPAASSLAGINDVNNWLGRSQWPDNNLDGSFDEFRIYNTALDPDQIVYSRDQGPYGLSPFPIPPEPPTPAATPAGATADWQFSTTMGGALVGDGDAVGFTIRNEVDLAMGNDFRGEPQYVTYDPAEVGREGADGYAMNTRTGDDYPFWPRDEFRIDTDQSAWARIKLNGGDSDGVILGRALHGNWSLSVLPTGTPGEGRIRVAFGAADPLNGGFVDLLGGAGPLVQDGQWYDIGLSFDENGAADTVTLYVNGAVANSVTGDYVFGTNDAIHIGNFFPRSGVDALFDRVILWNSVADGDAMSALSVVPEPSSLLLALIGLSALGLARRRR